MIAIFIVNKRVKYRAIKIKTFVKQTYQSWNDEVVNLLSLVKGNLWFCGPLMCAVFTHTPTGQKDDKRKKRMEVGWSWSKDTTHRGKKKTRTRGDKAGINHGFFSSHWGGESKWTAPEDSKPHPSFLQSHMGTGRATSGGHLAGKSLPFRVGGHQGINAFRSQKEPPVFDCLTVCPVLPAALNSSQVGYKWRELVAQNLRKCLLVIKYQKWSSQWLIYVHLTNIIQLNKNIKHPIMPNLKKTDYNSMKYL